MARHSAVIRAVVSAAVMVPIGSVKGCGAVSLPVLPFCLNQPPNRTPWVTADPTTVPIGSSSG